MSDKISRVILRAYYGGVLALGDPYFRRKRRMICEQLTSDWNGFTSHGERFRETAFLELKRAARKVPFYKKMFDSGSLSEDSDIKDFPLVSKKEYQQEMTRFRHGSWWMPSVVRNTGGSTGNPFEFKGSIAARNVEVAHQEFFYRRLGYTRGDQIWSFGGYRINERKRRRGVFWLKNRIRGFPYGSVQLSALYLNEKSVSRYASLLQKEKPSFLRGYPSAIGFLANYLIEQKIQFARGSIKGVLLTSETVEDSQVKMISKAFNCAVFPQYGMAEVACFAFTKPNELRYYCSPFYGKTEVLNSGGEHVSVGEVGEIVATGFWNSIHPFIRYRTGDLAEYGGEERGFVILNRIYGRTQDYVIGKSGKRHMLVGVVHGGHLKAFGSIIAWQIRQLKQGEIVVHIVPNINWCRENSAEVQRELSCSGDVKVCIQIGGAFEVTAAGKRPFCVRNGE